MNVNKICENIRRISRSFDKFVVDSDRITYWENDVMDVFDELFGEYEGNKPRIEELIKICEAEIAAPKSWLTEFAARTALENLKGELEEGL